jgi:hypothetical protein
MIRRFKSPAPVREVNIVTYKDFGKQFLATIPAKEIHEVIPSRMKISRTRRNIQIHPAK